MAKGSYKVGKGIASWKEGMAQTITFVVTEDCNLRCKYCYITHKCSDKKLSLETAKKFIDYILSDQIKHSPAVVVEFIGGEPFLEIELIDQISDYFKRRTFEEKHPWYWNYRFSFSTNGVNFDSDQVQAYLKKNEGKVSVGITIDGTKEKHDLQRVFPDGSGSYDRIIANLPLYLKQFLPGTKVTFASDDLIYLKDSIIDLWEKGITEVAANVVFEDVWKEGDDRILESQLKALADYVLDHRLFDQYCCTLFDEGIGGYLMPDAWDKTNCGAGKMMAVGPEGDIYPCIRYKAYSLNHREEWTVGNVNDGIDMERVRPFIAASNRYQSDQECLQCPVANGCAHCQGFNYDEADVHTNFYRATYICKMHKARVRANDYYFAQLWKRYGIRRESMAERQQLILPLADNYVSYCCYQNTRVEERESLTSDRLHDALCCCAERGMEAVFLHPWGELREMEDPMLWELSTRHIVSAQCYAKAAQKYEKVLPVFDAHNLEAEVWECPNCILNLEQKDLEHLSEWVIRLLDKADRINVNIHGLDRNFSEDRYLEELCRIKEVLVQNPAKEVNLITDRVYLDRFDSCQAGTRNFVYGLDGQMYTCIGMWEDAMAEARVSRNGAAIEVKGRRLYQKENHPICQKCDAYQCRDCMWMNQKATREICVSPSWQCRKSHIEREVSLQYQKETGIQGSGAIRELAYRDPIVRMEEMKEENGIYYKYVK